MGDVEKRTLRIKAWDQGSLEIVSLVGPNRVKMTPTSRLFWYECNVNGVI